MTDRQNKSICTKAHRLLDEIALEASKLPKDSERKIILEVLESPVKTRVLLKFLIQMDCFDFVQGYSGGGIFKRCAIILAHQHFNPELVARRKKRKSA